LIFEPNDWKTWSLLFLVGEWLIRIGMILWIPNRRSPEAAKGWLLMIFFSPSLGILLYWLIGRPKMPASRRRKVEQLISNLAGVGERLKTSPNLTPPDVGPDLSTAVHLAKNTGRLPILGGNSLELLNNYTASIRATLNSNKRYPTGREASLQRPAGKVKLWFVLTRNGSLQEAGIDESSNSIILDNAALATVRRTTYMAWPEGSWPGQSQHKFTVTLDFLPLN
jgi:TonB family protein